MRRTVCLVSVIFMLVACGASNSTPSPAVTQSAPSTENTPIVSQGGGDTIPTFTASTNDVNLSSIDCGDLTVMGSPLRASDTSSAQAAVACFTNAIQVCAPAVLTIRESATGVIRQFNIEGTRDNCLIRQALQPDANSAPAIADCVSANIQNGTLEIKSCSHLGDFILDLGH